MGAFWATDYTDFADKHQKSKRKNNWAQRSEDGRQMAGKSFTDFPKDTGKQTYVNGTGAFTD